MDLALTKYKLFSFIDSYSRAPFCRSQGQGSSPNHGALLRHPSQIHGLGRYVVPIQVLFAWTSFIHGVVEDDCMQSGHSKHFPFSVYFGPLLHGLRARSL